jgi:hypothetical protein
LELISPTQLRKDIKFEFPQETQKKGFAIALAKADGLEEERLSMAFENHLLRPPEHGAAWGEFVQQTML